MFDPSRVHTWQLAHGRHLDLGPKSKLMAVLNVTPDSFSDGGKLNDLDGVIRHAEKMIEDGADILDIGGESTRPGADPVTANEEQARVLPVVSALAKQTDAILSIDTCRAETAERAIQAGAHIINDVWGFQKDPQLAHVAARMSTGVCAMHTGRARTKDADVIKDQIKFLENSLHVLKKAGVNDENIVLDPGFGFAKDEHENIELLGKLEKLHVLGYPLLIGTSRKRFIGSITGQDVNNRDIGTAATSVVARMKGGAVFRVHDIASNRDALAVADAILRMG